MQSHWNHDLDDNTADMTADSGFDKSLKGKTTTNQLHGRVPLLWQW